MTTATNPPSVPGFHATPSADPRIGAGLPLRMKGTAGPVDPSSIVWFEELNHPVSDTIFIDEAYWSVYRARLFEAGELRQFYSICPDILEGVHELIRLVRPAVPNEEVEAGWWRFLSTCTPAVRR